MPSTTIPATSAGEAPRTESSSNRSAEARSASSRGAAGPAPAGRFRDEVPKLVRTAPGQSTETPTWSTPWDLRLKKSVSVSAVTACLETPYGPSVPANAPKIEDVFTRCPVSWLSNTGMNARTPFMTPFRFTPRTQSHSPGGHSHSGPCEPPTPALLQTTWTAPNCDSAASRSASTADRSATSVTTGSTEAPNSARVAAALDSAGSSTSAITTCMPSAANRSASPSPIPLAAPVTTATRPGDTGSGGRSDGPFDMTSLAPMPDDLAAANRGKTYGDGPIGIVGWPPLKCSSESTPVARVSQRVSVFRGSSASATQAIEEYHGSDHGATTIQAKVSAQVAATTVGTSGESRLYRYQARV